MAAVGKHFPGAHSPPPWQIERSSIRVRSPIAAADLVPFAALISPDSGRHAPASCLPVDDAPAGYCASGRRDILRERLGFGWSFLRMTRNGRCGGVRHRRARSSLAAGCDMVLACNDFRGDRSADD
jgi:beta-N-acetylhexosaminidase